MSWKSSSVGVSYGGPHVSLSARKKRTRAVVFSDRVRAERAPVINGQGFRRLPDDPLAGTGTPRRGMERVRSVA